MFAINKECQKLKWPGICHAAQSVYPERLGLIARERCPQRFPQFLTRIQCVSKFKRCRVGRDPPHHRRGKPGGYPSRRPVDGAQVKVVHHQRLMGELPAIFRRQIACKPGPAFLGGCRLAVTDHMSPQGNLGTCDVPPEDVQALVPGVQRLVIRAFKAPTATLEDLDVVSKTRLDNVRRYVRGIGNPRGTR